MDQNEIDRRFSYHPTGRRFSYHPPVDSKQLAFYEEMRGRARRLAKFIVANTPQSREQSLAITNLEKVVMWANAGLARRSYE